MRLILSLMLFCFVTAAFGDEVDDALSVLANTGPQAEGSQAARAAADVLAGYDARIVPRLLVAMDTPNVVAANWYRTVYESIVAREQQKNAPQFPIAAIQDFVRDPQRSGRPRRLALALLDQLQPEFRGQMMPQWLEDREFRADAVQFTLQLGDQAKNAGENDHARTKYESAFRHARDSDQVLTAVNRLKAIGVHVDPVQHMGFIHRWYLLGPFNAPGTSGFAASFAPENAVDLQAEYDDGRGGKLTWKPHQSDNPLGELNLIQAVAPVKEAVAYAYAEVQSPRAQTVQLRCSADDNLTVWLNGHQVLAREQWLNGTRLDRFSTPVELKAGNNRMLVKICQGPRHVNPEVPNNWSFQLRLCDESGGAIEMQLTQPPADDVADLQ